MGLEEGREFGSDLVLCYGDAHVLGNSAWLFEHECTRGCINFSQLWAFPTEDGSQRNSVQVHDGRKEVHESIRDGSNLWGRVRQHSRTQGLNILKWMNFIWGACLSSFPFFAFAACICFQLYNGLRVGFTRQICCRSASCVITVFAELRSYSLIISVLLGCYFCCCQRCCCNYLMLMNYTVMLIMHLIGMLITWQYSTLRLNFSLVWQGLHRTWMPDGTDSRATIVHVESHQTKRF